MQNKDIAIEINPIKGIIFCIVAYFFISSIGLFEKCISASITVPTILFFQNLICLLLIIPELVKTKIKIFTLKHKRTYLIRIAAGLGCYAALFYVIRYIPISEALLYQYSASLWVPFIMFFWLKVNMPKNLWYGIIVGFIGITLILKPTAHQLSIITFIGILCGVLQGISMVAVRKLSVSEPTLRILFFYFLIGVLVTSFFVVKNWTPPTLRDSVFLLGVGVSTYLAQKFFTVSLQYANATTLAPICYLSILFSGLLSWIFWNELPSEVTLLGMIFIICGCLLTILITHQNKRLEKISVS